jgi:hypothetical protein
VKKQDRTPDQLKLPYALWTRQAVSDLNESVYGIRLTARSMGKQEDADIHYGFGSKLPSVVSSIPIDPAQKRYNTVPHSFRVFAE